MTEILELPKAKETYKTLRLDLSHLQVEQGRGAPTLVSMLEKVNFSPRNDTGWMWWINDNQASAQN